MSSTITNSNNNNNNQEQQQHASEENKSQQSVTQKKRRRSRKGLEKIYECTEPNCGKKFTRLEHLSRHQLNRKYLLLPPTPH